MVARKKGPLSGIVIICSMYRIAFKHPFHTKSIPQSESTFDMSAQAVNSGIQAFILWEKIYF